MSPQPGEPPRRRCTGCAATQPVEVSQGLHHPLPRGWGQLSATLPATPEWHGTARTVNMLLCATCIAPLRAPLLGLSSFAPVPA